MCQSLPRPQAIMLPAEFTFAQQIGIPPQFNVFILFLAQQSQKCMPPSDPAVMNHLSFTGLKLTAFTGQRIVFPPSSCLLLLKVMIDFYIKKELTGLQSPLTFLVIDERLALPSIDAIPKVLHLGLIAIDCICEFFPKSFESTIDRMLELLISTTKIFQLAVPATKIGY